MNYDLNQEEMISLDAAPPRICVQFRQGKKVLGVVEKNDFYNSGEVPNLLLPNAVVHWNALQQNVKDGVTAHIVIVFGDDMN